MSKKTLALAAAPFVTFLTTNAFAQEAAAGAANKFDAQAMAALGAGIAIGLAVLGGGLGQGKAAEEADAARAGDAGEHGVVIDDGDLHRDRGCDHGGRGQRDFTGHGEDQRAHGEEAEGGEEYEAWLARAGGVGDGA